MVGDRLHGCNDVHCDGRLIVTVGCFEIPNDNSAPSSQGSYQYYHDIHILNAEAPYTKCRVISRVPVRAHSVFSKDGLVYVGVWDPPCVVVYNTACEVVGRYGRESTGPGDTGAGVLRFPRMCGSDSSGRVLVADYGNNRLQVMSGGEWGVVSGMTGGVCKPMDVIIQEHRMYVLHGELGDKKISVYNILE